MSSAVSTAWDRFSAKMASQKFDARPALAILRHLDHLRPLSSATLFLDIGCGAGAVFERALDPQFGFQLAPTARLLATDLSPSLTEKTRDLRERMRVAAPGLGWERVETEVMDAADLSRIATGSVSHVSANLVLFMVPNYTKALAEVRRVLQPGGVVALTSHLGNQWMECVSGYSKKELEILPTVWRSQEGIAALLVKAGLESVATEEVDLEMAYETPEQTLGMLTGMPFVAEAFDTFSEERRAAARIEIRARIVDRGGEKGKLTGRGLVGWGRKGISKND